MLNKQGEKELNLNEKIVEAGDVMPTAEVFFVEGVREFIRRLREITKSFVYGDNPPRFAIDEDNITEYFKEIDKLAGDKLIWKKKKQNQKP